jgi:hypothetical protein
MNAAWRGAKKIRKLREGGETLGEPARRSFRATKWHTVSVSGRGQAVALSAILPHPFSQDF